MSGGYECSSVCVLYLSAGAGNFVNDVSKHNVLVVSFRANFLPLGILSQPDVVAQKRVADAEMQMSTHTFG